MTARQITYSADGEVLDDVEIDLGDDLPMPPSADEKLAALTEAVESLTLTILMGGL